VAIIETFSKRKHKDRLAGQPDVYQYDTIPTAFRNQVIHIWKDAIGRYTIRGPYDDFTVVHAAWDDISSTMAREAGIPFLGDSDGATSQEQCEHFLLHGHADAVLDIVEFSFRVIDVMMRDASARREIDVQQQADDAINELNGRFREHSLGYQYEAGILTRIDSEFVHAEIVKPALMLLRETRFAGPEQEFRIAHEHYRAGRPEEAMTECLKAFESVMKVTCDARGWKYPATATAKGLIELMFEQQLIPVYLRSELSALRAVLEGGVPTIRNKTAGHGQGAVIRNVPLFLAGYCINLTAANILLISEANGAL
jgi:hypothetical protein